MLPVFLLEDDKQQLATYQQIINNAIMINEFAMKLIVASDNVADFERQLTITKQGVFFLDMEISDDKQAGLKVAERIKAQVPFAQIAFITTHEELSFLTLKRKIAPFDYILKDEGIESIKQHLRADVDLAYENYEKNYLSS
ncbi:response regulator [Paucilactobacillus hokkaidonensis]|uniref:response regulator n=1 Tax=Paucilactobacillus hokkaidonensis TaxID=1193095 RepID=UPI000AE19D35|nr:response regulator [Paucilactobacillus hokkaidonensis]